MRALRTLETKRSNSTCTFFKNNRKTVKVPIKSVHTLPELMQPRSGVIEPHVSDLIKALKNGAELPPLLVMEHGKGVLVIDGHHRLEALKSAEEKTVKVTIFKGDAVGAFKQATEANSKAVQPLNNLERQNRAWEMVRTGQYSKNDVVAAASISRAQVGIMRKALKILLDNDHNPDAYGHWFKANKRVQEIDADEGLHDTEFTQQDIDLRAQCIADGMRKSMKSSDYMNPAILAKALQIVSGRRFQEIVDESVYLHRTSPMFDKAVEGYTLELDEAVELGDITHEEAEASLEALQGQGPISDNETYIPWVADDETDTDIPF